MRSLAHSAGWPAPTLVRTLGRGLRRFGAGTVVRLGFLAELGWAFVGSVGFGLGARPPVASEFVVRLWLAVAVLLAGVIGLAAWLALPERESLD